MSRTAPRFLLALVALAGAVESEASAQEVSPAPSGHGVPLPAGARGRIGPTRLRHGDRVTALAFAPDGKVLASGGADRTVRLWDLATGNELACRREHAGAVTALAFAAGGKILASNDADRAVLLWDVAPHPRPLSPKGRGEELGPATLTQLRRLPGLHQVSSGRHPEGPDRIVVSRDGKTLITLGADVVVFWDAQTGKALRAVDRSIMYFDCIALSPDGKLLAGGYSGVLHLVDAATAKPIRAFKIAADEKTTHIPAWLKFLPGGQELLVADENKGVHVVDVAAGKVVRRFEHHVGWPCRGAFALAPDGKTLIAADIHSDGGIGWYDVATGQRRRLDQTKPRPVTFASVALSHDGKRLAAGDVHGSIHLFDGVSGAPISPVAAAPPRVTAVALAPDGKTIATADHDHEVRLWDAATTKEIGRIEKVWDEVRELAFAPDGRLVINEPKHLRFYDLSSPAEVRGLPSSYRLAFGRDGTLFSAMAKGDAVEFSFWDARGKKLRTLPGHWLWHAAISPDGKLVATAASRPANDVQLWDAATGEARHRWPTRAVDERCVAFSPDGQWLALAGEYPSRRFGLRIWNTVTGDEDEREFGAGVRFRRVAYSPDGKVLIAGSEDGLLCLWDGATGKEHGRVAGHFNRITELAFSADGKTLVSGSRDGTALIWDVAELVKQANKVAKEVAAPVPAPPPRTDLHGDPLPDGAVARMGSVRWRNDHVIGALDFSPDGSRLVIGGSRYEKRRGVTYQESTLAILDVPGGKEVLRFQGHDFYSSQLAFSPDGRMLAARSHEGLGVWDAATGKRIHRLGGVSPHPFHPDNLVFSPDGKTLAVDQFTQEKEKPNLIRSWDAATGRELPSLPGHETPIEGLAFSADGTELVSLGAEVKENRTVCRWSMATGKKLGEFSIASRYVRLAADSTVLAYHGADKKLHVIDVVTQRERCVIDVQESAILFAPGGKVFAAGGNGLFIRLWDAATGKVIRQFESHSGLATRLKKFSPDGKLLVSMDDHSQGIRLWNVADGREIITSAGHRDRVDALAYSPDGKVLASASKDLTIRLWTATTGQPLHRLTGHAADITCVTFSPDGKTLASASKDQTTRLWDAVAGKEAVAFKSPNGGALATAFATDGKTLLTVHDDGTVQEWDVAGRKEQRHFSCADNKIVQAAFSPDGKALAILDGDRSYANRVRLWNVAAGKELSTIELGPVDPLQSRATVGWALAFSSDGRVLATSQSAESYELRLSSSNHAVRFWEVATGKEISKLDGMRVPCRFLAFAPDGRDFAHGHGEAVARARGVAQSVVARDISAGVSMGLLVGGKAEPVCLGSGRELAPLAGHLGAVTCLAFSPDGKSVATGSADQTILTWDRGRFTPAKETPASQLSAKELDALWAELADSDAARAYRAIGRMTASPDETTAFLKRGLQPAVAADPRRVRQLIGELDDQRFAVRQKATEELEQIGDLADPEVRRAVVEGKSLEHRRRLEQLLGKYDWFSLTPEHLRRQRALTILERLGTAEARRVLTDLAEGAAAARQTQAARSALQRLGRRGID